MSTGEPSAQASRRFRGVAAILAAGAMWGSVGLFVRFLTAYAYSPLTIVFVRLGVAFLLLVLFLVCSRQTGLFRIHWRDLWCFVGAGATSAVMLNFFYSLSLVINSLALASILLAMAPVFVLLFARLIFRESITAIKVQALCIVLTGCVLTSGLVGSGGTVKGVAFGFSPLGVLVGLLAGLGWGLYSIMTRLALNQGYHSLTINIYTFLFGSIICLPFTDLPLIGASIQTAPVAMLLFLLLHALFASLLPYMLYTYGLKFIETGKASIIAAVDPVVAALLGFFIYGEHPDAPMLLGFALILFGITLLNLPRGLRTFLPEKRRA
jgi:drug/metabolite transporter (DMT)-like permease